MNTLTETLMNVTGQTGVLTGSWFNTAPFHSAQTHVPINVAIIAGTATVVVEGVNDTINGTPIAINTLSASDAFLTQRFKYLRARLSAATGAQVVVTSDKPLLKAS